MQCPDGEVTCKGGIKSKIKVIIDNNSTDLEFDGSTCTTKESSTEPTSSGVKCWRFWGKKNGQISQEYYGCGVTASYRTSPDLPNNGAWLILDGVLQVGEYFYYWSGVEEGTTNIHERGIEVYVPGADNDIPGGCLQCITATCRVVVQSENDITYRSKWGKKCDYEVACDDNCPPDHVKCESNHYPGYCCIPCESTAQRINNLANRIK